MSPMTPCWLLASGSACHSRDRRGCYAHVAPTGGLRDALGVSERRTIPPMAFERITIDPARMGGVPCIRDLRVTVSMVLGQLAAGRSVEELLGDYPYLERADVTAALEYAAAIVNEREMPVNRPA